MPDKHLLIVDDNEDILFFLKCSIRQMWPQYQVTTAVDGFIALALLKNSPVDLMLIDYKLPGMNGLTLAEKVCEIAPATQIVMMSANKPPGLEDKVSSLKLAGYVDKPFRISEIKRFVTLC